MTSAPPLPSPDRVDEVDALLDLAREQLGMQVAFVSRFEGGERVIRNVSTALSLPVGVGLREPLEQSHCQRIVDGRMGPVTPDTLDSPSALEVPATLALGIRSLVGVPIEASDGTVYGTLCCIDLAPDPTLRPRDAGVLRVLARAVASLVEREDQDESRRAEVLGRLRQLRQAGGPQPVYQPIVSLGDGRPVGVEALSRFPADLGGTPPEWFADAARVGVGTDLELEAIDAALRGALRWPGYVSVNCSPEGVLDPRLPGLLGALPADRVVLELTEHVPVDDYTAIAAALAPLRAAGVRLAIDDCGAGYSSLSHVLALLPDILKLDLALVRHIDRDHSRQALTSALLAFAGSIGATVIAEGVETGDELGTLGRLGVPLVQGYLLGRPDRELPHPTRPSLAPIVVAQARAA